MSKIRVGMVGMGTIAELHLPVLLSLPDVEICWVTDLNAERAQHMAFGYQLKAVPLTTPDELPDCDLMFLAIPPGVREGYINTCAERGIAVFAEKPFAITASEHQHLASLFPPHRVGCGYQRRTYGQTLLLRQAIQERWFGDPTHIRVAEGARTTRSGTDASYYDNLAVSGGGVLMSLGCHSLDTACFITDATSFTLHSQDMVLDDRIDRKATAEFVLERPDGHPPCEVSYCVSWLDPQPNTIEVTFPSVILHFSIRPGHEVTLQSLDGASKRITLAHNGRCATTSAQAFYLEWEWFLQGLQEQRETPLSASQMVLAAQLMDALYEAAGRGAPREQTTNTPLRSASTQSP